jgi:20S proteasome alpha/beta subunit
MTAIVGVLCKDGVVIGSDSANTFSAGPNHPTIEQTIKKCSIINNDVIVCGAGAVGLSQRFQDVVATKWPDLLTDTANTSPIRICTALSHEVLLDFSTTHVKVPTIGFGCLFGFVHDGAVNLCEFELDTFQPEIKTKESAWYVSMGSGQNLTDPFLSFVNEIFWEKEQPNLKEGIYGVIWALQHAITLNTGGINGPLQIVTLSKNSAGSASPKMLDAQELSEHMQYVSNFQEEIKGLKKKFNLPPDLPLPSISLNQNS